MYLVETNKELFIIQDKICHVEINPYTLKYAIFMK